MRIVALSVSLVFGLCVMGCGSGEGACVVPSATGNAGWEACHNDWEEGECSDRGGTFHGGDDCKDVGYTKACPSDGSNSYRLPSYSCL